MNVIETQPHLRHFCVFDELYSGTNPYEAISSAYSYLDFISKNKNVRFLLTTHFIRLCNLFEKKSKITNKSMKTIEDEEKNPQYTYKITKGISNVKGGVTVLKNLKYPEQIIKTANHILDKI